MKRTISILSLLMAALVALAGGAVLSVASGLPLAGIAAVLFGASFIPMP